MYSNKRRSHVHIIKQFETKFDKYTGTRVVIFIKNGPKLIYDYDSFIIHHYENSKNKVHSISRWERKECDNLQVIKKEMTNYSMDGKYRMLHILYEAMNLPLDELILFAFDKEGIEMPKPLLSQF